MRASSGERKIYDVLVSHGISFIEEYEFADLISTSGRRLRFDFAVFDDRGRLDFLIEFQGKQHYQPVNHFGGKRGMQKQRYNDSMKRRYCMMHNINLVVIPYWEENNISYDYIMQAAGY